MLKPAGLPEDILSLTTTRHTGYSKGSYSGFNTAFHVGDEPEDVYRNRVLLQDAWGIPEAVTLSQVHGSTIHEVTGRNRLDVMFSKGDGLITSERDIPLGILTADCYNLHLIGREHIANLHCGWRSVAAGIVQKCISMFEERGDRIINSVIGPGISAENYEVGEEVASVFREQGFTSAIIDTGSGLNLSIRKVIETILKDANAWGAVHVNKCTYVAPYLYSYRRDRAGTGRLLSVVMRRNIVC
ncbi:polyphenol oxidase family protein [Limisalsivibrio acetivorans]|uniref:polyphenol oxidase family protein n=1 Tax=Limisalsivibrio acetivorans TaxID=1304888 RepID=UPI00138ACDE3|nr:polyphenol oxidase family protein [Limisalsivibrio acetivorans]